MKIREIEDDNNMVCSVFKGPKFDNKVVCLEDSDVDNPIIHRWQRWLAFNSHNGANKSYKLELSRFY